MSVFSSVCFLSLGYLSYFPSLAYKKESYYFTARRDQKAGFTQSSEISHLRISFSVSGRENRPHPRPSPSETGGADQQLVFSQARQVILKEAKI